MNPISEASETSLDELFSKKPPYSQEDVKKIIAKLRSDREFFVKQENEGVKRPRGKKEEKKDLPGVSLDDLLT